MTHWMQTYARVPFEPLQPVPDQIRIEDIAHALSMICRFGGHSRDFYSVAEHSLLVSYACDPKDALAGLLHDAAEAYVGDLIRPIKHLPQLYAYREAEDRLLAMILHREGLAPELPWSVHRADDAVLALERDHPRVIGGAIQEWAPLPEPPDGLSISCFDPVMAKQFWLYRYKTLGGRG